MMFDCERSNVSLLHLLLQDRYSLLAVFHVLTVSADVWFFLRVHMCSVCVEVQFTLKTITEMFVLFEFSEVIDVA